MDDTLRKLTDYSLHLAYEDLTPQAVHECKRRFIDALACIFASFDAEPSKISRRVANRVMGHPSARVVGTLAPTSPELAAFVNGVMMRCMDFNDATGSGGGHPSDMFGALLAAGEVNHVDGKSFLTASVLAYELYLGFFSANRVRNRGWDHVIYTVLAATAGVGKIMGLDRDRMANALSLAVTPNMALEVARRGELSMWKGCAGGNAARNAIFAAQLAADGMTGPAAVFEGEHGVWNAVGTFDWVPFPGKSGPYRVTGTQIKLRPFVYQAQSPVEAALSVRSQIGRPEDIASIVIKTYWFAWSETGSEPEKWAPTTRETADHSIPYLVCIALMDGKFDDQTFAPERIADPHVRALMQKVKVIHDTDLDRFQPDNSPCRLEITLNSGALIVGTIENPKGHAKNPASDDDIETKFYSMNGGRISDQKIAALLSLCWQLENLTDIGDVISATRM